MLWIILSLIVSVLKALWELAGKILTNPENRKSLNEYDLAYGWRAMGWLIVLPLMFFISFGALSLPYSFILLCSTVLNAIATVTALKAVKYGDLSLVGPLSAFTIPFLLITGFFIAWESPNMYGIFGVFFIFLWSYFLQIWEIKKGLFGPVQAIYKNRWARYMLVTAIIWSVTIPLDKLWIVEYWVFQWMFMLNIAIAVLMTFYTYIFSKRSFHELSNIKALKKISLLTVLWWVMLLIQMFALKLTLSIYVVSIKRASWIFSIIFWALFFKEKNIMQKIFAVSIMLIWVGIITFFGNI